MKRSQRRPKPSEPEQELTVAQKARQLQVDPKTVYRHALSLGGYKVGGIWRFPRDHRRAQLPLPSVEEQETIAAPVMQPRPRYTSRPSTTSHVQISGRPNRLGYVPFEQQRIAAMKALGIPPYDKPPY